MQAIDINTGMDGFHVLSSISRIDKLLISGTALLTDAPGFVVVETMAQLGALHVRWLNDFSKHAFLLKVEECSFFTKGSLNGALELSGRLIARSQATFSYDLEASMGGVSVSCGRFLFSVKDYDETFRADVLEARYREVFRCLRSDSGIV